SGCRAQTRAPGPPSFPDVRPLAPDSGPPFRGSADVKSGPALAPHVLETCGHVRSDPEHSASRHLLRSHTRLRMVLTTISNLRARTFDLLLSRGLILNRRRRC